MIRIKLSPMLSSRTCVEGVFIYLIVHAFMVKYWSAIIAFVAFTCDSLLYCGLLSYSLRPCY